MECSLVGCKSKAKGRGLCHNHYQEWGRKYNPAQNRTACECEACGKGFRSRDPRPFCSLDCYLNSDRNASIMVAARARWSVNFEEKHGYSPGTVHEIACLKCGETRELKGSHAKNQKFCGRSCYRSWFAENFDSWIANPEDIALPQGYDEFLDKAELPCLFDGCYWSGLNLGQHVAFTHHVSADRFKKMAGFNKKTGLVARSTRKLLEERGRELHLNLDDEARRKSAENFKPRTGVPQSLEAREHMRKGHALAKELRS